MGYYEEATYIPIGVVATVSVNFVNLLFKALPLWNDEVIFHGFADKDDIFLNTSEERIRRDMMIFLHFVFVMLTFRSYGWHYTFHYLLVF